MPMTQATATAAIMAISVVISGVSVGVGSVGANAAAGAGAAGCSGSIGCAADFASATPKYVVACEDQ